MAGSMSLRTILIKNLNNICEISDNCMNLLGKVLALYRDE